MLEHFAFVGLILYAPLSNRFMHSSEPILLPIKTDKAERCEFKLPYAQPLLNCVVKNVRIDVLEGWNTSMFSAVQYSHHNLSEVLYCFMVLSESEDNISVDDSVQAPFLENDFRRASRQPG